jgi:hypothetical protein
MIPYGFKKGTPDFDFRTHPEPPTKPPAKPVEIARRKPNKTEARAQVFYNPAYTPKSSSIATIEFGHLVRTNALGTSYSISKLNDRGYFVLHDSQNQFHLHLRFTQSEGHKWKMIVGRPHYTITPPEILEKLRESCKEIPWISEVVEMEQR